jgi:hypothetical protein
LSDKKEAGAWIGGSSFDAQCDDRHGDLPNGVSDSRSLRVAIPRAFVIHKSNDNYSRKVLEKLIDYVELLSSFT